MLAKVKRLRVEKRDRRLEDNDGIKKQVKARRGKLEALLPRGNPFDSTSLGKLSRDARSM